MKLTASSVLPEWKKRIANAKEHIIIFAPYWDELVIDLLDHCRKINKQQGNASLPVTIVTTDNPTNYLISSSAFAALEKAHKDFLVKVLPNLHAKSMIVDGNIVSCGSQNFTYNSHFNMKELSILFEESSSKTLEGWKETYTSLLHWEEIAEEVDDSLIEELRERIKGYEEVEQRVNFEKSKRQLKSAAEREKAYDVRIYNGSLFLTDKNISYPDILALKRAQADKSDWMTLIDSNHENQLLFVRMNEQSISYALRTLEGTITLPSGSELKYVLGPNNQSNTSNLLITLSSNLDTHTAYLQLCYHGEQPTFVNWRTNKVKWEGGRSTKQLRSDLEQLINSGTLLDEIFETFKPFPVFGDGIEKIGAYVSPQSNTLKLLKFGKHPIWYLS
ncbi:phospholipase D-like domain-containing protein [Enterovibrio norvegicus]|uniref:phospholipase D-like domain-containing protein n=1 Tax=Enterovibrio norvegicus TaxID=188144 RepID=UPI000C84871B|nr:phospholipase D-like domain-containing protein [Enterovibrio norvegicus]PML79471.1 hypothetical protein BCT69_14095 [Enterovibrio norvegicus]